MNKSFFKFTIILTSFIFLFFRTNSIHSFKIINKTYALPMEGFFEREDPNREGFGRDYLSDISDTGGESEEQPTEPEQQSGSEQSQQESESEEQTIESEQQEESNQQTIESGQQQQESKPKDTDSEQRSGSEQSRQENKSEGQATSSEQRSGSEQQQEQSLNSLEQRLDTKQLELLLDISENYQYYGFTNKRTNDQGIEELYDPRLGRWMPIWYYVVYEHPEIPTKEPFVINKNTLTQYRRDDFNQRKEESSLSTSTKIEIMKKLGCDPLLIYSYKSSYTQAIDFPYEGNECSYLVDLLYNYRGYNFSTITINNKGQVVGFDIKSKTWVEIVIREEETPGEQNPPPPTQNLPGGNNRPVIPGGNNRPVIPGNNNQNGGGVNEYHFECDSFNQCVSVPGSGDNRCSTDSGCGKDGAQFKGVCDPQQGVCINQVCQSNEDCTSSCKTDADCGKPTSPSHLECYNNACVIVSGPGQNKCGTIGQGCRRIREIIPFNPPSLNQFIKQTAVIIFGWR